MTAKKHKGGEGRTADKPVAASKDKNEWQRLLEGKKLTENIGVKLVPIKDVHLDIKRTRPGVAKQIIADIERVLETVPIQAAYEIKLSEHPEIKIESLLVALRRALGKKSYRIVKTGKTVYVWKESSGVVDASGAASAAGKEAAK